MAEGALLGVVGGGAASAAALTSLGQPLSLATAVLVVSDALRALREAEPERLIIVGVSGLAGAGKSTLASKLCSMFAGSRVVQLRKVLRVKGRGARERRRWRRRRGEEEFVVEPHIVACPPCGNVARWCARRGWRRSYTVGDRGASAQHGARVFTPCFHTCKLGT